MGWYTVILLILIVINLPLYKWIFRLMFDDPDDVDEAVKYSFTPNFISFFRGQYWEDKMATMKLNFCIFGCIAAVGIQFLILMKIISYLE